MINKTMTFFWSGEKLSWLRYMTLYSFRKLNPDWVMELHLSKPIHNLDKKWSTREVQDNFSSISKDSIDKIYDLDDMVTGDALFAATGVTSGSMLSGIEINSGIWTHTIVMRSSSKTIRWITAHHQNIDKFNSQD